MGVGDCGYRKREGNRQAHRQVGGGTEEEEGT